MIPQFEPDTGQLPPGEHTATWQEVVERFGYNARRRAILAGLRRAALNLRDAGCTLFLLDGSFVTSKPNPSDFDACCDYRGMDPFKIDPILMTDGDRMKTEFMGEVYSERGWVDEGYTFRQFFQLDRDDRPKGIIRLLLETIP